METLKEQKARFVRMMEDAEELLKDIKERSEERLEEYSEEWGERALDPSDPLVRKTDCARDAVEGAEEGLKYLARLRENVLVMEDY